MTTGDEEETDTTGGRGRPNLWWQRQREEAERDVFKGEYTTIRHPKSGHQTVKPEDVQGSYELCWCGLPEGHDWVGKAQGRKHPRKVDEVTASKAEPNEVPRVSPRELNGFEDDVRKMVVEAVNTYGLRYRITARGAILYPKDGSDPYTIHKNARPRSIKAMAIWMVKHVEEVEPQRKTKVESDDIRRLAEAVNSPERPVPTPPPAKKEQSVHEIPEAVAQSTEALEEPRRYKGRDASDTLSYESKPEVPDWRNPPGQWGPYRRKHDGSVVEGFERLGDTIEVRCTRNNDDGTPCGWTGQTKGLAGHLIHHDPQRREGLWGKAAQEKKKRTVYSKQVTDQVLAALNILHEAVGFEVPKVDDKKVTDLEKRVDFLTKRNALLEKQVAENADLRKAYDDLRAKLELLRDL